MLYLNNETLCAGLFHHAIAQSGSAINPWAFEENPRKKAFVLGEVLGCRTNDSNKLVEFLRTVSVQRLVESLDKLKAREVKVISLREAISCTNRRLGRRTSEKKAIVYTK
jgi:carboxylesterase type B